MNSWVVSDTALEPLRWRVVQERETLPPKIEDYFSDRAEAYQEAQRRNEHA